MFYTVSCIVIAIFVILSILLTSWIYQLKKRVSDLSYLLYENTKKIQRLDSHDDKLTHALSTQHETLASLTTSVERVIKGYAEKRNEKIMPTPQLAEMINQTIQEQITIECQLLKKTIAPNRESFQVIIENVIATYPHVNEDYLTKKCIAAIEIAINKI